MGNRLKDIWGGFEATTTRRLTSGGVDNIHVPRRLRDRDSDHAPLPEGVAAPAEAAFASLRDKLEKHASKFSINMGGRSGEPMNPDQAPEPMAMQSFDGEELIKGMRATALRTERSEYDYGSFMSTDAGKTVLKKHKRKRKRFGLF